MLDKINIFQFFIFTMKLGSIIRQLGAKKRQLGKFNVDKSGRNKIIKK
jgi:hypothetical protein